MPHNATIQPLKEIKALFDYFDTEAYDEQCVGGLLDDLLAHCQHQHIDVNTLTCPALIGKQPLLIGFLFYSSHRFYAHNKHHLDFKMYRQSYEAHLMQSITRLIRAGLDVNLRAPEAEYRDQFLHPLQFAVSNSYFSLAHLLLDHGASVAALETQGKNLFHFMAEREDCDPTLIQRLIDLGLSINQANEHGKTPLLIAAQMDNESTLISLIDHGADVNQQLFECQKNAFGSGQYPYVLLTIAKWNRLKSARVMLQAGVSITVTDEQDNTALHLAASHGHLEMVQLLVQAGSSLEAKNDRQQTPLMISQRCYRPNPLVSQYLQEAQKALEEQEELRGIVEKTSSLPKKEDLPMDPKPVHQGRRI